MPSSPVLFADTLGTLAGSGGERARGLAESAAAPVDDARTHGELVGTPRRLAGPRSERTARRGERGATLGKLEGGHGERVATPGKLAGEQGGEAATPDDLAGTPGAFAGQSLHSGGAARPT